jgi:hypothetical protein
MIPFNHNLGAELFESEGLVGLDEAKLKLKKVPN